MDGLDADPDSLAALRRLITAQHGMVARRQLTTHGIDADQVRNQVAALRCVERTPRVISTTTGELTLAQRQWLAVLHAGPRSMLANLSAAGVAGLAGWERPYVSVMVDDELSFEPVDGVDFFRSRRPFAMLRSNRPGIPRCRLEPAVLLWAAYEAPTVRVEHAVVAAVVQQRLTTPTAMVDWIERLRPLRHARPLTQTLAQIVGGAHSGVELQIERMCRRFGVPPPERQTRRLDRDGRVRWTDAEWRLADGRTLVLEVDGAFHTEVRQAADDAKRSRRLTTPTRTVLRCTAFEVTHEPHEVAVDLIALGLPGRVEPTRVPDDAA